jgi:hypothetical protein
MKYIKWAAITFSRIGVVLLLSLALFAAPYPAAAELAPPQVEFSAESVTESGGIVFKEKIYYAPGKIRKELEVSHGKQIEITRLDKKVGWLLMTEDKLYLERPLRAAESPAAPASTTEPTVMGKELINNIATTKFKTVATQPDGQAVISYIWVSQEGITVKMDMEAPGSTGSRATMTLQNLQVGKQPAALFEIPPGFRKFSLSGFDAPSSKGSTSGTRPPAQTDAPARK